MMNNISVISTQEVSDPFYAVLQGETSGASSLLSETFRQTAGLCISAIPSLWRNGWVLPCRS